MFYAHYTLLLYFIPTSNPKLFNLNSSLVIFPKKADPKRPTHKTIPSHSTSIDFSALFPFIHRPTSKYPTPQRNKEKTMEGNNNHQNPPKTQEDSKATKEADASSKRLINGHDKDMGEEKMKKRESLSISFLSNASFMKWTMKDVGNVLIDHPIPFVFALSLFYFMGVEYTLSMVSPTSPPFDIGFELTQGLQGLLARRPDLNTIFAALNTVRFLNWCGWIDY